MYITQLCGDLICCSFSIAEQLIPKQMKDWTTLNCSVCSTICHYDFQLLCRHTLCFPCLKVRFYTKKTQTNSCLHYQLSLQKNQQNCHIFCPLCELWFLGDASDNPSLGPLPVLELEQQQHNLDCCGYQTQDNFQNLK